MNDDQYFLANAYLDGELTAEERGIAESDPEVMAEVEQLGALQASMRAIEPPTDTAREVAISAALAEFGRPAARVIASPIPFRPRPAYARYLGVAAAAVTIGLLAVVVARAGGGSDDSGDSDAAAEIVAEDIARNSGLTESVTGDEVMAADGAAESPADLEAGDAASGEASAEIAAAPAADDAGGVVSAESDAATATQYARPEIDPDRPLTDELELGSFGTYLLEEQNAGRAGSTPNTPCSAEFNILAETIYVLDGVETEIYVAVQTEDGVVLALDLDTCVVIVEGPLF